MELRSKRWRDITVILYSWLWNKPTGNIVSGRGVKTIGRRGGKLNERNIVSESMRRLSEFYLTDKALILN